jgi:hypothetical protein
LPATAVYQAIPSGSGFIREGLGTDNRDVVTVLKYSRVNSRPPTAVLVDLFGQANSQHIARSAVQYVIGGRAQQQ